jgi:general secretion pathway protein G
MQATVAAFLSFHLAAICFVPHIRKRESIIRTESGFTFIELIITLAIMGVLVLVAVPLAQVAVQRDKERDLRAALMQIREGIDSYKRAAEQGRILVKLGESGYPKNLNDLVEGVPDQRSPTKQNLYFMRRVPRDPLNPDANAKPADTWRKRSYASPPDNPSEGADILIFISNTTRWG